MSTEEKTDPSTTTPPTVLEVPARASATTADLVRGATVGRYIVLDRLGAGGMGVVYAAYDPELNRRIALKLVVPKHGRSDAEQARLLREAQALARLSHPNVVAIHDVGSIDNRVFIAMELIEGNTLHEWLRERDRSWREVVAVFREAGEGLAAAHEAGLVHRDFKSNNVLVSDGGRVRVMDFGLARAVDASSEPPHAVSPDVSSPARDALGEQLTHAGMLMGTPVFMPPEVFLGERGDAAGDQFSFAVSLHHGLHGEYPFDRTLPATDDRRWTAAPPKRGSRVPRWVNAIVGRGLARNASARYPNMRALVDALGRDPAVRRRKAIGGFGTIALVAAGILVARTVSRETPSVCEGAEAKLAGIWPRKAEIRAALLAANSETGANTYARIEPILDAYSTDWVETHRSTCEATSVHGEQSEEVLTLAMTCLDRRRADLAGVVSVLANSDRSVAMRAIDAVRSLPAVSRCRDIEALKAPIPPPDEPALRARVNSVYAELAKARVTRDRKTLTGIAATARELGWAPLAAEAELELGSSLLMLLERDEAGAAFERALIAAFAANDDRTLARTFLARVELFSLISNFDQARRELTFADALVGRLRDDRLHAQSMFARSNLEALANNGARALELADAARAIQERTFGADSLEAAEAYVALCSAQLATARTADAERSARRALSIRKRHLGSTHVDLLDPLDYLDLALLLQHGQGPAAWTVQEEIEAVVRANYGADHEKMAVVLESKVNRLAAIERYAEAIALNERVIEIYRLRLGERNIIYANALDTTGELQLEDGDPARALETFERASAVTSTALVELRVRIGQLNRIAKAQTELGRRSKAKATLEHALKLADGGSLDAKSARIDALDALGFWELENGDLLVAMKYLEAARVALRETRLDPGFEAEILSHLAAAYVDAGRAREALPLLETALADLETRPVHTRATRQRSSFVRFALARALEATGGDRAFARELAKRALADCRDRDGYGRRKPAIQRWLAGR